MKLSAQRVMVCSLLLAGMLLLVRPAAAQQGDILAPPAPPVGGAPTADPSAAGPGIAVPPSIRYHQQKMLAEKGERELKQETDQLLQLAQQLKASVDKTNRDVLSIEVIKKTKEIEKLAKQIREKMQNGH
jgi:hypothetical protein